MPRGFGYNMSPSRSFGDNVRLLGKMGFASAYIGTGSAVRSTKQGVRGGLTRLGRVGGKPQRALEGTGVSGRFGKNMKLNDYYRRRGKIYAGGAIGTSAGVMGLRSRSSGGSGELPSQNMPMY